MEQSELIAVFDQQADLYDSRRARTRAISEALFLVLESVFFSLPERAHILCVGAGTGDELLYLAHRFPGWKFTVVEPSSRMMEICQRKAEEQGCLDRCHFHCGLLDSLSEDTLYDGATAFLVSQFMLDSRQRVRFFQLIGQRLTREGGLVSADLATVPEAFDFMVESWMRLTSNESPSREQIENAKTIYRSDVAVVSPVEVEALLMESGFTCVVPVYQAGLLRGWFSKRSS